MICIECARSKLAGKPLKPCAKCIVLNVSPRVLVKTKIHAMVARGQ